MAEVEAAATAAAATTGAAKAVLDLPAAAVNAAVAAAAKAAWQCDPNHASAAQQMETRHDSYRVLKSLPKL
jgi:hypothetical protein